MDKKEKLIKRALTLSAVDKAEVIDKLIRSLEEPDQTIDELWKKESENRIDAYDNNKLSSVSVEEAASKYKNK